MRDIQTQVATILEGPENLSPAQIQEKIGGVSLSEVLRAFPPSLACEIKIEKNEDLYKLWERLDRWEVALFLIQTAGVTLGMNGKLPPLRKESLESTPILNWRNGLDGYILVDQLGSVFLLNYPLFGKENLALCFLTKGGELMFSVYAGRGKDSREIPSKVYDSYVSLWNDYSPVPFQKQERERT